VVLHYEVNRVVESIKDGSTSTTSVANKIVEDLIPVTTSVPTTTTKPRKVYVDLGANCGDTYDLHMQVHKDDADEWEAYLWEPNPQIHHFYLNDLKKSHPNVNIFPHAASIEDGEMELYIHKGFEDVTDKSQWIREGKCSASNPAKPSAGTTLFRGSGAAGKPVTVKVVNFPKWLKTLNLNEHDKFVLKIDIEGAEYEILDQMLSDKDDNNLCLTDLMQVEFHPGIAKADDSLKSKYTTFDTDFPSLFKQKCGRDVNLELIAR